MTLQGDLERIIKVYIPNCGSSSVISCKQVERENAKAYKQFGEAMAEYIRACIGPLDSSEMQAAIYEPSQWQAFREVTVQP